MNLQNARRGILLIAFDVSEESYPTGLRAVDVQGRVHISLGGQGTPASGNIRVVIL